MRFDYYAATVDVEADQLVAEAAHHCSQWAEIRPCTPRHGYHHGAAIYLGDDLRATLYAGGQNGRPHIFASGKHAPDLATFLRQPWGQGDKYPHHVTRG